MKRTKGLGGITVQYFVFIPLIIMNITFKVENVILRDNLYNKVLYHSLYFLFFFLEQIFRFKFALHYAELSTVQFDRILKTRKGSTMYYILYFFLKNERFQQSHISAFLALLPRL